LTRSGLDRDSAPDLPRFPACARATERYTGYSAIAERSLFDDLPGAPRLPR
jgi:hypothetical protein